MALLLNYIQDLTMSHHLHHCQTGPAVLDYCNPFWIVVLPLFLCPYSLLSPQGQSGLEKAIPDASHITQDGSQSPQSDLMPCHILASFTATYLFCCLHSSHRLLQWAMQAPPQDLWNILFSLPEMLYFQIFACMFVYLLCDITK